MRKSREIAARDASKKLISASLFVLLVCTVTMFGFGNAVWLILNLMNEWVGAAVQSEKYRAQQN